MLCDWFCDVDGFFNIGYIIVDEELLEVVLNLCVIF